MRRQSATALVFRARRQQRKAIARRIATGFLKGLQASENSRFFVVPAARGSTWSEGARKREPAVSRVLSGTIIHLGQPSPTASSDLPGSPLGTGGAVDPHTPLFGLAPGGVCRAAACYHPRGALLPHLFTLTGMRCTLRRCIFCGTFHGLASSRHYLAPCPMEPGLSSGAGCCRRPAIA